MCEIREYGANSIYSYLNSSYSSVNVRYNNNACVSDTDECLVNLRHGVYPKGS